jgi:hypothetical protein
MHNDGSSQISIYSYEISVHCLLVYGGAAPYSGTGAFQLSQIRVLDNLDEELADTVGQLEGRTGAQIVGKMGRTLLLYRPSMRKLKAAQAAEEKAYKYQKRKNLLASRTVSPSPFPGIPKEMFLFSEHQIHLYDQFWHD